MSTEHVWKFVGSYGEDAPGRSLDTYEQCSQCGALRHDYRHDGGQLSPNYPEVWKFGRRVSVSDPCLGLLGAARSALIQVGDVFPQGRVVGVQEETENLRGYAWVERQCPDGTVERETIYLDELRAMAMPTGGTDR